MSFTGPWVYLEMMTNDRRILFFDGECGLCSRFVGFVRKRDRTGEIKFAPIGGQTWTDRFGVVEDQMEFKTVHLVINERHFRKSSAVVRVLMCCSGLWPVVGCVVWLIPAPVRNLGYACVAASRYRLFGKASSCQFAPEDKPPCILP